MSILCSQRLKYALTSFEHCFYLTCLLEIFKAEIYEAVSYKFYLSKNVSVGGWGWGVDIAKSLGSWIFYKYFNFFLVLSIFCGRVVLFSCILFAFDCSYKCIQVVQRLFVSDG